MIPESPVPGPVPRDYTALATEMILWWDASTCFILHLQHVYEGSLVPTPKMPLRSMPSSVRVWRKSLCHGPSKNKWCPILDPCRSSQIGCLLPMGTIMKNSSESQQCKGDPITCRVQGQPEAQSWEAPRGLLILMGIEVIQRLAGLGFECREREKDWTWLWERKRLWEWKREGETIGGPHHSPVWKIFLHWLYLKSPPGLWAWTAFSRWKDSLIRHFFPPALPSLF